MDFFKNAIGKKCQLELLEITKKSNCTIAPGPVQGDKLESHVLLPVEHFKQVNRYNVFSQPHVLTLLLLFLKGILADRQQFVFNRKCLIQHVNLDIKGQVFVDHFSDTGGLKIFPCVYFLDKKNYPRM